MEKAHLSPWTALPTSLAQRYVVFDQVVSNSAGAVILSKSDGFMIVCETSSQSSKRVHSKLFWHVRPGPGMFLLTGKSSMGSLAGWRRELDTTLKKWSDLLDLDNIRRIILPFPCRCCRMPAHPGSDSRPCLESPSLAQCMLDTPPAWPSWQDYLWQALYHWNFSNFHCPLSFIKATWPRAWALIRSMRL